MNVSQDQLMFTILELKAEISLILAEYCEVQNKYEILASDVILDSLSRDNISLLSISFNNNNTNTITNNNVNNKTNNPFGNLEINHKNLLNNILIESKTLHLNQVLRFDAKFVSKDNNHNNGNKNKIFIPFQITTQPTEILEEIFSEIDNKYLSSSSSSYEQQKSSILQKQREIYENRAISVLAESQLAIKIALDLSTKEANESSISNSLILQEQQDIYETKAEKLLLESQLAIQVALDLSSKELSQQVNSSNIILQKQQEMYEKLAVNVIVQSQLATSEALIITSNLLKLQENLNSEFSSDSKAAIEVALDLSSKGLRDQIIDSHEVLQQHQEKHENLALNILKESQNVTCDALFLSSGQADLNLELLSESKLDITSAVNVYEQSQLEITTALILSTNEVSDQVIVNSKVLLGQQEKYEKLALNVLEKAKIATSEALLLSFAEIQQQVDLNADISSMMESLKSEAAEKDINILLIKIANSRLQDQITRNQIARTAEAALKETGYVRAILTNVAIDLKTPLQSVMLAIETFMNKDSGRSSEEIDILGTLESACNFMSSMINRAIDSTKIDSGVKLVPILTSFDVVKALSATISWMKPHLMTSNNVISLTNLLPSNISHIFSDKSWIQENLLCYLSNAVKYSSGGSIDVLVTIVPDEYIRISVEDHGIGISLEAKRDLFHQFSQVNRITVGGTGLGLYSLKIRSEAIGGFFGVEDRNDGKQGSVFWFSFPCRPDFTDINYDLIQSPLKINAQTKKLSILIVDDSQSVCKILSKMIRKMGHQVTVAENGLDGLNEMVNSWDELDLVLMDIQMPIMDGIEATKRFRVYEKQYSVDALTTTVALTATTTTTITTTTKNSIENFIRLPIICSSANDCQATTELAIAAGMNGFLPKPFSFDQLMATISTYKKKR